MIRVQTFTFNGFQENTYVISEGSNCIIIDPGCSNKAEENELDLYIRSENLKPELLINTHCHIDHVLGNEWVKNKYGIPLLIHEKELVVLQAVKVYAPNYGFPAYQESTPDRFISAGEKISFGDTFIDVIFVPGHAPGHIGLYFKEDKNLFAGDVLFRESIGRTDLPGGDFNTLISSIRNEVFSLPDDVIVFPGHGPATTVGHEKIHNPFCGIASSMA
jgi:hydroxyacylglutathione hydrolase